MSQTSETRSATRGVDPELRDELEGIAHASGCELVNVELKGGTLRLILDKEGGVSLGDCEHVSRQASALLDVLDFGKSRYLLEVSSPGLDRELYGPRDYERFTGRLARVTFTTPEGAKRTVVGRLAEFRPDPGEIVLTDEASGTSHTIGADRIVKARLEIEL